MQLYRLAYKSDVKGRLSKADLRDILKTSSNNNFEDSITGALVFDSGIFLQILEGSRASVNRTYRRILADPRHEKIELVGLEPAEKRQFPKWSMALIQQNDATKKILYAFCGANKPVVDAMNVNEISAMMRAMIGAQDENVDPVDA